MRVIIPVASMGSKFKSKLHTNMPETLIEIAGKPILKYIIDECLKLNPEEIIFVVGYKRKLIYDYVKKHYPDLSANFVSQKKRDGDASAVMLALENITKEMPTMVVFGNSLADYGIKKEIKKAKEFDLVLFSSKIKEPSCCGVLEICENGDVLSIDEKPENPKSNFVSIGTYYFKSSFLLKKILNEEYEKNINENGKYKISQIVENYIKMVDMSVKAFNVEIWFDCRGDKHILEANRYFLEKKSLVQSPIMYGDSLIIPPSYVASDAVVENSIVGPYASIGYGAVVKDCIIKNSVASSKCKIENTILTSSIIGNGSVLFAEPSKINIPDKSEIFLR